MKAAVSEQARQPLVIKDAPDPSVGARDVLVRVKACGVCHSDLHIVDGLMAARGLDPFPLILGHEVTGVVEEVGSEVRHLKRGAPVGVYWIYGCGTCRYCLAGKEQACVAQPRSASGVTRPGGYAEYIALPADHALALPEELDFVSAAPFFCAGLTMYSGFKNAGLQPGQRAAVLGIGGLGHLAIPIARAMGAEVIALTSTDDKVELARQLGAHHAIVGTADLGQKLQEAGGADVVLSTTLEPGAIGGVIPSILPQGTLVLTGLSLNPLPLVPALLVADQLRIIGSAVGSRRDMQELLHLAVQHNIRPMTETYPLEEANAVHDRLRANQVRFRAVLTPD